MVVPFKEWERPGLGTRKEENEKQEFGFGGFECVKCNMPILLTSGKNKKKCWMCKSGVQKRSLSQR